MNKILVLTLVLVLGLAGTAFASGTSTITVEAIVDPGCTVSGDLTITFPNIDPGGTGNVTANAYVSPTLTCNANLNLLTVTVTGKNDVLTETVGSVVTMAYTGLNVNVTAGDAMTAGTPVDLLTGTPTIADTEYQGKIPGTYREQFTIDITP